MESIYKYLDNSLFLKWVYEKDKDLDEYWNYYLDNHPEERKVIDSLKNELQLFRIRKHEISEEQKRRLAERIVARVHKEKKSKVIDFAGRVFLKYAAIVILTVGITSAFLYFTKVNFYQLSDSENFTTAIAENGQISKLILPDSSVVWLNSGTEIKYATNFASLNREIFLKGQAFFQVTRNTKKPFKVFCKDMEVRVLGTRFNVSAYSDDGDIQVVLEKGKVELLKPNDNKFNYQMNPGQKAVYNSVSGSVEIDETDMERYVKWKEGILIFKQDPMSEVIPILQRKFDVELKLDIPNVDDYLFTATITNETLEEIVKSIAFTCTAEYKIINRSDDKTKVIISKN